MNTLQAYRRHEFVFGAIGLALMASIVTTIGCNRGMALGGSPEENLAGTWVYDEASPTNTGAGRGYQLRFAGKNISVFDSAGSQILEYPWTTYRYVDGDAEHPTKVMLLKTEKDLDGFAMIALNADKSQMLFMIAGNGTSQFSAFRRAK